MHSFVFSWQFTKCTYCVNQMGVSRQLVFMKILGKGYRIVVFLKIIITPNAVISDQVIEY